MKPEKRHLDNLKPKEKEFFDPESLQNPYSDSRILFGSEDEEIESVLVGIDIDAAEVLLADNLRSKGRKIDLLLSHHPSGRAYADLYGVMHMQSDILSVFGVPINIAEGSHGRKDKRGRKKTDAGQPYARAVDAARLLGIPFLCLHTPADNMVDNIPPAAL